MIKSDRKFGVEIEFFCKEKARLKTLSRLIRLVDDGSIRHVSGSAEYVSDVLQGKPGEAEIHKVCELIKKSGGSGDDPSMSVHVHIDGKNKPTEILISKDKPEQYKNIARISDRLARKLSPLQIEMIVLEDFITNEGPVQTSDFFGIRHYSLAKLNFFPEKNFQYYYIPVNDRFKWLQNMFYFYTLYSQVMEDIVSNSRKFGNMYCIPLGESYDLLDIEKATNMDSLYNVWYKGQERGGHYDDSRYHNVNFHSFWDRHGTVEIRSHGGTVDPNKILLWVKLHQKIADKLETMELRDIKPRTPNLHKEFVEFVEEPILQSYVKRLMGFYSGIKIK